jgi:ketosteroid isomerase-like protein
MKNYFLAVAVLLTGFCSYAQPEKEVEAVVEKFRLAMIDPTSEVLKSLTSADLSYGHSNGLLENQQQFIEALVSGKSDFSVVNLSDQSIKLSGKNVAIVRHKLKGETVHGGTTAAVNLGILNVWVKEKGGWKLLARQAFKL